MDQFAGEGVRALRNSRLWSKSDDGARRARQSAGSSCTRTTRRRGASARRRRSALALDIRRPSLGEPLPATLAEHAGVVVFGGPMSANDDLDWVPREIDWLGVPLREDKPLLGVCLGAQMLARQSGRPGLHLSRQAQRNRLLPASRRRRTADRCAPRRSLATSIIGTATASSCRAARGCWR